jgi:hypothetical protein
MTLIAFLFSHHVSFSSTIPPLIKIQLDLNNEPLLTSALDEIHRLRQKRGKHAQEDDEDEEWERKHIMVFGIIYFVLPVEFVGPTR